MRRLIENFESLTYQYETIKELLDDKSIMEDDGWEIEQIDEQQLIVQYYK